MPVMTNLKKTASYNLCSKAFCRAVLFCQLFLSFNNAWAQAPPNISYTSPQVYTVATPITTLPPTNSGGAVPAYAYGEVTTIAGTVTPGHTNAIGTIASFDFPQSFITDNAGNLYTTDFNNKLIRKITPAGLVTTYAGVLFNNTVTNGSITSATFNSPTSIVIDSQGNMYVADYMANIIRRISAGGTVTTFAGSGAQGFADGLGIAATFNEPYGLAVDAADNIYVADLHNYAIRKITPALPARLMDRLLQRHLGMLQI